MSLSINYVELEELLIWMRMSNVRYLRLGDMAIALDQEMAFQHPEPEESGIPDSAPWDDDEDELTPQQKIRQRAHVAKPRKDGSGEGSP